MNTADLTMSYEALVDAGREARQHADTMQWVEGDLALQVEALPGDERPRDPDTGAFIADEAKALKRYADDVGLPYSTLKTYRRVAEAWPSTTRAHASWAVHQVLAAQDDRFDLVSNDLSVRQAQKMVRDRTTGAKGKPGWHELLGRVGDDLIAAEKHMDAAEAAINDPNRRSDPDDRLIAKAARYAAKADDLTQRLRLLAES